MTGIAAIVLPAAAAALLTVEAALRLPFFEVIGKSRRLARKSLRLIRAASISDHWKERALPAYSAALLRESLRLLGMAMVLVAIYAGVVACVGITVFSGFAVDAALAGVAEAICAAVSAMLYLAVRRMLARHV